jgi:hypothetical protein
MSNKPKALPKIDPETLSSTFETAKENGQIDIMLQCTQIALLSEMKRSINELSSSLQEHTKVITDLFSDYEVGIEIYPKNDTNTDQEDLE